MKPPASFVTSAASPSASDEARAQPSRPPSSNSKRVSTAAKEASGAPEAGTPGTAPAADAEREK